MARFWERYQGQTDDEPTSQEIVVLDAFIKEYLYDRNTELAAMRCGFKKPYARQYGEEFYEKPYVQTRLKELMMAHDEDEDESIEQDRKRVLNGLRELIACGDHNVRLRALSELKAVLGLNAPVKSSLDINNRGGVMLVPTPVTADDWENAAVKQQQSLQETNESD